jgi:hypothetical protein
VPGSGSACGGWGWGSRLRFELHRLAVVSDELTGRRIADLAGVPVTSTARVLAELERRVSYTRVPSAHPGSTASTGSTCCGIRSRRLSRRPHGSNRWRWMPFAGLWAIAPHSRCSDRSHAETPELRATSTCFSSGTIASHPTKSTMFSRPSTPTSGWQPATGSRSFPSTLTSSLGSSTVTTLWWCARGSGRSVASRDPAALQGGQCARAVVGIQDRHAVQRPTRQRRESTRTVPGRRTGADPCGCPRAVRAGCPVEPSGR